MSTAFFLKALDWSMDFAGNFASVFLLLPLGLFPSALIIHYLAPEAEGQGTDRVIEAVHKDEGRIRPVVVPLKLLATVITIAYGGSAGKIGPRAQVGGGFSSLLASCRSPTLGAMIGRPCSRLQYPQVICYSIRTGVSSNGPRCFDTLFQSEPFWPIVFFFATEGGQP